MSTTGDSAGGHVHDAAGLDGWAAYYDLVHKGLPGEAEFYVGQAVRIGGRTLEIGCGTGRLAIPMAMSGVNVVGMDKSRAMLDECRFKAEAIGAVPGKLLLLQADMVRFALAERFDFVAVAYRTFMHLLTQEEQRSCLHCVREHLASDGVLVMNLWAAKPSAIVKHLGPGDGSLYCAGRYPIPCSEHALLHYCASRYEEHAQILHETHILQEIGKDDAVLSSVTLPLDRTWITPREMGNLVRLCGFRVEALFGDFDCSSFTESSTEMIWVLKPA